MAGLVGDEDTSASDAPKRGSSAHRGERPQTEARGHESAEHGSASISDAELATRATSEGSLLVTPIRPTAGERSRGTLRPSTRLGRYVVLDEIGEGGMGRVYAAYDPELDRRIALKLLRPELVGRKDPSMGHARLLREAQAMARLSHPNVLTVHDVGEVDPATLEDEVELRSSRARPLVFIAMELVDGRDLRAWLQEEDRSWREVLRVFLGAAEGLAAAHAAGLLHRDFKPDNVLIDQDGHVRVMDFGLARAVDERPSHPGSADSAVSGSGSLDEGLTRTGTAMGTPAYMAPEQWTNGETDARADQFAFCVSLWEALYGTRPFRGSNETSLRAAVLRGSPAAPENRHGVPGWLHRAMVRGLQVNPAARHPSMHALIDELRSRPRRRRAMAWSAAGASVFFAVGGLAYQGGRSTRSSPCRGASDTFDHVWSPSRQARIEGAFAATEVPFADTAWKRAKDSIESYRDRWVRRHTQTCEATHVHGSQSTELLDLRIDCLGRQLTALEALLELFATADAPIVEKAPLATARLEDPSACEHMETLRARAAADPAVREQVAALRDELTRTRVHLETGRSSDVAAVAERVVAEAQALGNPALEAAALRTLGDALDARGEVEAASNTLRRAVTLAERAADDDLASRIWASLAFIDGLSRGHTEAGLLAADYAEAKRARVGPDPLARAQIDSNRASVLYAGGQLDRAVQFQRAAVDALEQTPGDHELVRARFLLNLGSYQLASGELEAALESMHASQAIHMAELGPDHPSLALGHAALGSALHAMGRIADARTELERALALAEAQPEPDRRNVANVLNNLGNVLARLGEHEAAMERFEQSLALRRAILREDNPDIAQSLDNIGGVLLKLGRPDEALAAHEEALELRLRTQSEDHPWLAYSLHGIGASQLAREEVGAAIEALERALAVSETEAPGRAATEFALARALWAARREPARVLALARDAHDRMTRLGDVENADQVRTWLAERDLDARD